MKLEPDAVIHYLKPAGFFFLKRPGIIRTVLGSCVTVTMFSKRTGIGSACHPILPECRDNKVCYFAGCKNKFKYVECVIPEMMRLFKKSGVSAEELEIKLFGGSEMITNNSTAPQFIQIGLMNVEMALNVLYGFGVQPQSHDFGGKLGRRLLFDTATGNVWIKKLTNSKANVSERKDFRKQILMQSKG